METLIRPQFVYTPENTLEVTAGLKEVYHRPEEEPDPADIERMVKVRTESLEILDSFEGVEIKEDPESIVTVSVDVPKVIHGLDQWEDDRISTILGHLDPMMIYHPQDHIDRVIGIDAITDRGSAVSVNHHFQRWMESPGSFSEELARKAVEAMALPFDADYELHRDIKRNFRYEASNDGYFAGPYVMFCINLRRDNFRMSRIGGEGEREAEVQWLWPELRTVGSCACMGVAGDDRQHCYVDDLTRGLYEMGPHNVDYGRQALSQLMALGVMTYSASQYEGREDIFEGVQWR